MFGVGGGEVVIKDLSRETVEKVGTKIGNKKGREKGRPTYGRSFDGLWDIVDQVGRLQIWPRWWHHGGRWWGRGGDRDQRAQLLREKRERWRKFMNVLYDIGEGRGVINFGAGGIFWRQGKM